MYISDLIKKDKKELNKLSKEEIIKTIIDSKWTWENNIKAVDEAKDKLVRQSKSEESAKMILIGYLGLDVERDEYNGSIVLSKIDLCELIGKALNKAARY